MTFDERVRSILEGLLHDSDRSWTISPCMIKQAIMESARLAYVDNKPLFYALEEVLYRPGGPSDERASVLRAYPFLSGLCSRYMERAQCTETAIEREYREESILLLRGGVQRTPAEIAGRLAYLATLGAQIRPASGDSAP